jgi:methionine-rich copper-binding protein CopC
VSPSARRLVTILGVLVLALSPAAPVLAHAELVASDPANRAVLTDPPAVVTLRFSEGLDAGKRSIRLVGPGGAEGPAKPERDGAKVMALEGLVLGAGVYTVRWTAGAGDGHVERGTVRFTVLEPAPAPATPSPVPTVPASAPASEGPSAAPTEAPPTAAATSTAHPSSEPVASAEPLGDVGPASNTGSGTDILVVVVAALALVGGMGAWILRRNRGT